MTQASALSSPTTLCLVAPIDGVVVPLEALPDPVFAQKMLGDGLAIDPTGSTVVAPCAGEVTQLHRAHHALTIRTSQGVSVLVHIGLDTVRMGGEGFAPRVKEGDRVEAGQTLIQFDLDLVAQKATSASVEVVVTEGATTLSFKKDKGIVIAGQDEVVRLCPSSPPLSGVDWSAPEGHPVSAPAVIRNPNGMHARPAATLVQEVKRFDAMIQLGKNGRYVSASSVTEIMSLDLARGDEIEVRATGTAAQAAVDAVCAAIFAGLGEDPEAQSAEQEERYVPSQEGMLGGIPAAPGLAIGKVHLRRLEYPLFPYRGSAPEAELATLDTALGSSEQDLRQAETLFLARGENEKAQIFAAHRELLQDAEVARDAHAGIKEGLSAAQSFFDAMQKRIDQLGTLKSPILRQRATDMKDVTQRVLYAIVNEPLPSIELEEDTVLACDDLTPSTLATLPTGSIRALVTEVGGATSHAAIIARSMGVPYVASLGETYQKLEEGQLLIVDGTAGAVTPDPSENQLNAARKEIARLDDVARRQQSLAHEAAYTRCGRPIEVAVNIGSLKDAQAGDEKGCDGVGLLRSEFLFMGRRDAPSEEEQAQEYVAIAKTMGQKRPLVVRTLDVGGDKPLPYIPLDEEENPFLGVRGVRVAFKYPEILRAQVRAALRAAPHCRLHLMFPMVANRDEFLWAQELVRAEIKSLGVSDQVSIGVMVEVPSAALNARWLAQEVDFFSIGTNDLTQYTLAMDRGHPELSAQADAFDPAVLRLIEMTAAAAHAEGKWVGVCGGLAAETLATPLLIGLGIDELSVPAPSIPELKAQIRNLSVDECRAVAEGALAQPSAEKVRALLSSFVGV